MQLVQAWKNTIIFFYPSNIKFFVLITANSIWQAYKIIIKYWWWLVLLISGLHLFWWQSTKLFFLVYAFLYYLFIFAFCLSTRPSVAQKNISYFFSYLLLFFPVMIGFVGIKFVGASLIKLIGSFGKWQSIYLLIKTFTYAVQVFFLFFFLDSSRSVKQFFLSFIRSVKMTIYNYPTCLVFGLIIVGIEIIFAFSVGSLLFASKKIDILLRIISLMSLFIFAPLQLSIFTNIYIKKLHEQFDYYFSK
ncbi:MAG: hypothetical protein WCD44_01545 [Candidatus Babeliales bacterium]